MPGGRASLKRRRHSSATSGLPFHGELSCVEEKHPVAELRHEVHRVGGEDDGLSLALRPFELLVALLPKRRIANR